MQRYDLVIYGATGFTGAYILERLVTSEHYKGLEIAVAGRNHAKLMETLEAVSKKTDKGILFQYRLYGESVVKAAVENGASHIDISGEPAFLEKMQMLYGEKAKENVSPSEFKLIFDSVAHCSGFF
ncbi:unnamed protein product [Heligmosomoides polygyrus]|uniref:Sacchrp_dh_NADP domain-containing protein n=1 Tax=Heligmosomoides polygyrus TaxID=6339 RepID=A0A183GQF2_HELPZ|nr:unnamed protein product [Heligmosomoides polygyrus]